MPHPPTITAADIRAEMARARVPMHRVAAAIDHHPAYLSRVLNEHIPLTPELGRQILELPRTRRDELARPAARLARRRSTRAAWSGARG